MVLSVRTLSTASLFKIWQTQVTDMSGCLSDHRNVTITGSYTVAGNNTLTYIHNVPGRLVRPLELNAWRVLNHGRTRIFILNRNLSSPHCGEPPHRQSPRAETICLNTIMWNDWTLHIKIQSSGHDQAILVTQDHKPATCIRNMNTGTHTPQFDESSCKASGVPRTTVQL